MLGQAALRRFFMGAFGSKTPSTGAAADSSAGPGIHIDAHASWPFWRQGRAAQRDRLVAGRAKHPRSALAVGAAGLWHQNHCRSRRTSHRNRRSIDRYCFGPIGPPCTSPSMTRTPEETQMADLKNKVGVVTGGGTGIIARSWRP